MCLQRHAEFVAIDQMMEDFKNDLSAIREGGLDLYVTCEPCIMCAGALSIMGFERAFFGCPNDKFGGCGSVLSINENGCGTCSGSDPDNPDPAPPVTYKAYGCVLSPQPSPTHLHQHPDHFRAQPPSRVILSPPPFLTRPLSCLTLAEAYARRRRSTS